MSSMDWFTIVIYLILMVMGWFSVCGATYDFDTGLDISLHSRAGLQLLWMGTAVVLGFVIMTIDERIFESFSPFLYAFFMVLLFVTPFLAHDTKGSMSWLNIGSFKLQPAEIAKFGVALFVSRVISSLNLDLRRFRDLAIASASVFLPIVLIIMQKETGSALVYFAFFLMFYRQGMPGSILFVGMSAVFYFVVGLRYADFPLFSLVESSLGTSLVLLADLLFTAGLMRVYTPQRAPVFWVLGLGLSICGIALLFALFVIPFDVTLVQLGVCICMVLYLLYLWLKDGLMHYGLIALFSLGSMGVFYSANLMLDHMADHQQKRIRVLLGLEEDPKGTGYNVKQANIAIGSGGLTGKGFLMGTQTKLRYVPEQETDFIYCTVGEEQGFVGSTSVLLLFLALILRLIHLAERQMYSFGRIYGYCVLSIFFFHVFINVGMVLGLLPVIGIPLPFFSYGGSSLWGFTTLLFIFLRLDASRNRLKH